MRATPQTPSRPQRPEQKFSLTNSSFPYSRLFNTVKLCKRIEPHNSKHATCYIWKNIRYIGKRVHHTGIYPQLGSCEIANGICHREQEKAAPKFRNGFFLLLTKSSLFYSSKSNIDLRLAIRRSYSSLQPTTILPNSRSPVPAGIR